MPKGMDFLYEKIKKFYDSSLLFKLQQGILKATINQKI